MPTWSEFFEFGVTEILNQCLKQQHESAGLFFSPDGFLTLHDSRQKLKKLICLVKATNFYHGRPAQFEENSKNKFEMHKMWNRTVQFEAQISKNIFFLCFQNVQRSAKFQSPLSIGLNYQFELKRGRAWFHPRLRCFFIPCILHCVHNPCSWSVSTKHKAECSTFLQR